MSGSKRTQLTLLLSLLLGCLSIGCTAENLSAEHVLAYLFPYPTPTSTLIPPVHFTVTHTPTLTPTPLPTLTPTSTPTLIPTNTQTPTITPTLVSTTTPTSLPTKIVLTQQLLPTLTNTPLPVILPNVPPTILSTSRPSLVPTKQAPYFLATGTIPATGVNNVYVQNPRPFNTVDPQLLQSTGSQPFQSGTASIYADYFQGLVTANGEIFDHAKFTAAHEWLALGATVRVTAIGTGRSVVVRINDRIPVGQPHIIDMTRTAANSIGIPFNSILPVRVDIVSWP